MFCTPITLSKNSGLDQFIIVDGYSTSQPDSQWLNVLPSRSLKAHRSTLLPPLLVQHHLFSTRLRRVHLVTSALRRLPSVAGPLQYVLAVFVQLELRDLALAWRDADGHTLPVALLARHSLYMNDVFEAVDRCNFAFAAFVGSSCDDDFVVLADGY